MGPVIYGNDGTDWRNVDGFRSDGEVASHNGTTCMGRVVQWRQRQ